MALVDQFAGVIFDYGGVLAFHQAKQDAARMAAIAGFTPEELDALYWSERGDYDKGVLTGADYWNGMARKRVRTFDSATIQKLIDADNESWIKFDREMYRFAEQLRTQGKRLAVLSNMPRDLGETIRSQTEGFAPFHHLTLSYEIGAIKPDAAIYQHCLEGLGTAAGETLFLDDRPENIEGARRLGIHAIRFTTREEVLPGLAS